MVQVRTPRQQGKTRTKKSLHLLLPISVLFVGFIGFQLFSRAGSLQSIFDRNRQQWVFAAGTTAQKDLLDISTLRAQVKRLEDAIAGTSTSTTPTKTIQTLPTCRSLMNAPNSPVADGSFLTNRDSTPNVWTLRADGSRQLNLPFTCQLHRYTASEARQCLAKRHVSFIGDSLTRYQFISLAYFIEKGKYPPRFGKEKNCTHFNEQGEATCSPSAEPNACMEGDWKDFQVYHRDLGGGIDGGTFNGRFQCLCARKEDDQVADPAYVPVENFLYVSDDVGASEGGKVILSFISELGWGSKPNPVRGWNFTDCAYKGTCRMTEKDNEHLIGRQRAKDFDWSAPLYQALNENSSTSSLHHILPDVDIVMYNRGLRGMLTEDQVDTIMPLLHHFAGGERGRCFFKTTTASPDSKRGFRDEEMKTVRDATIQSGCGIFDASHLTKAFYGLRQMHPQPPKQENGKLWNYREWSSVFWDANHFTPWVYEELNNMFLNVLCNAKN